MKITIHQIQTPTLVGKPRTAINTKTSTDGVFKPFTYIEAWERIKIIMPTKWWSDIQSFKYEVPEWTR